MGSNHPNLNHSLQNRGKFYFGWKDISHLGDLSIRTVCTANKPDIFILKFLLFTDVKSKYLCNGFHYSGCNEIRPAAKLLSVNIVSSLVEPFRRRGRNITTINFFTSVGLAENLKQKVTDFVGSLNRARIEVPPRRKIQNFGGPDFNSERQWLHSNSVSRWTKNKVLLLNKQLSSMYIASHAEQITGTISIYKSI